jgi:invasion protein IalB
MPRYRILIEGKGVELATQKEAPICGFFVTRLVKAATAEAAGASALASVEKDWTVGCYAQWKPTPSFAVIETEEAGFFARLTVNTAYIFHRGQ